MLSDEEIFAKVRTALEEALSVDADQVTPDASLAADLEAESIDFLDIIFRLEKAFEIKIPRGEFIPENLFNDPAYVANDVVTPAGLEELRKRMPFARLDEFSKNPKTSEFGDKVLTVQFICDYIKAKLSGQLSK